jgi:hypothetical protein
MNANFGINDKVLLELQERATKSKAIDLDESNFIRKL